MNFETNQYPEKQNNSTGGKLGQEAYEVHWLTALGRALSRENVKPAALDKTTNSAEVNKPLEASKPNVEARSPLKDEVQRLLNRRLAKPNENVKEGSLPKIIIES